MSIIEEIDNTMSEIYKRLIRWIQWSIERGEYNANILEDDSFRVLLEPHIFALAYKIKNSNLLESEAEVAKNRLAIVKPKNRVRITEDMIESIIIRAIIHEEHHKILTNMFGWEVSEMLDNIWEKLRGG